MQNGSPTLIQEADASTAVKDIWYSDGNIVLEPGHCSKRFKVYKGILSERSAIFRDMLATCNTQQEDSELVDGCPLVKLSDDPFPLSLFLAAIFGKPYVSILRHFVGLCADLPVTQSRRSSST
jgi:hypothetical protein